jgi:hypothetical protein
MPSARAPTPTDKNSLLYLGASAALAAKLQASKDRNAYVRRVVIAYKDTKKAEVHTFRFCTAAAK